MFARWEQALLDKNSIGVVDFDQAIAEVPERRVFVYRNAPGLDAVGAEITSALKHSVRFAVVLASAKLDTSYIVLHQGILFRAEDGRAIGGCPDTVYCAAQLPRPA